MTHVVALSGGKDSTALALRLTEMEPREYIYLCTPAGDELPEMVEHWAKLEKLLHRPLVRLTNRDLAFWIGEFKALPNWRMRWCTRKLKIEPTIAFLVKHQPTTHYVGLRADEEGREGIYGAAATVTRYPLREWGWGLAHVLTYLRERGVRIPRRTNCARCYDQRLNEWWDLWKNHPDLYADAERQEEEIGATFRGPNRDTWPAGLRELRARFELGKIPRRARVQGDLLDDDGEGPCRACTL